jgi:hypothetical protein
MGILEDGLTRLFVCPKRMNLALDIVSAEALKNIKELL